MTTRTRQVNIKIGESEIYDPHPRRGNPPVGARGYSPAGRIFRYSQASATALTVGQLCRKPANDNQHADMAVATACSAGVRTFTATMLGPAVALDDYKDGLVYVNDGSDQGHIYAIVGNSATLGGGTLTLDINTKTITALTTSSYVTIIKNRYDGVRVTEPSPVERTLGAAPVAVTASYYFWLQTGGPACLIQDGELYENRDVVPSVTVRGATMAAGAAITGENVVFDRAGVQRLVEVDLPEGAVPSNAFGYALDPRVDTDHALVQMELD